MSLIVSLPKCQRVRNLNEREIILKTSHIGKATKCSNLFLFTGSKSGPIDLVFGVPSTTQLSSRGFEGFKTFVKKVASAYPLSEKDTNVGIIQYGDDAKVILPLSEGTSSQTLNQRLDGMRFKSGGQNVPEALKLAGGEMFTSAGGGRAESSKYFVFGAGSESNTQEALRNASRQLQYQGVSVMPVPISDSNSDRSPLKSVASTPVNEFYLPARDVSTLQTNHHTRAISSIRPGKKVIV